MFLGEYRHTLDAKGRVSLPAKFRGGIPGGRLVVSKGLEGCLYVTPVDAYSRLMAPILEGNDFDPQVRSLRRFFMSGATEVELDSAGRVNIPAALIEHAGLDRELAVLGAGERIEIWDTSAWEAYTEETAANAETTAAELASNGTN